jgi:hypothetical protein
LITAETEVARPVLLVQGAYYLATGLWPLVSMRSFECITGPKTDKWLVKTVGILVAAIGSSLLVAARRKTQPSAEARLLAAGSAAGLTLIDIVYVAKRRIAPVYLLDALGEFALVAIGNMRHPKH